ncbi:Gamma-tubulin complex component 3, partial [Podila humilis]
MATHSRHGSAGSFPQHHHNRHHSPQSKAPRLSGGDFPGSSLSNNTGVSSTGNGDRMTSMPATEEGQEEQVEESAILRDLMFVFQGIDGKMVKFGAESGTCSIDPYFNISNSTRSLVSKLTELGWLYKRINTYVQTTLKESTAGLVGQSFCSALQHELVDYFKLIAVLEAHIAKDTDTSDNSKGLSLKRLLVWTQDSLQRLRLMSVLVECCQDLQGGALISTVHDYTQHGDPLIQQFINHMLERVSEPFYVMLQRWIYEGELDDPRTEFFIACDPEVEEEDMWQRKYFIREEMLPAFIEMPLAKKILSIGKSLNFLRHKCHDEDWFLQTNGVGKTLRYGDIAELEGSLDAAYTGTSQRLLHLLVTKFKLLDHLTALKRYILLFQGDFIQHLMESLGTNLSQPANTLFRHNLTGTLETAIRSSNAQYDDPDILRRLDVRLLEISPGDSGWDVFSLDYHVDSPINTILTPVAMHQYLKVFNFLWRLKRVEFALFSAWRRQTTSARAIHPILELVPELHHCRIVCSEMIHFVCQLQYYILFEVLECSWDELLKTIENNTTDLDSLIEAHSKYLRDVSSKGLLTASHDVDMMPRLLELLATILDYKVAQDNLYNYALAEIERRERLVQTAERRTRHGQWGLTDQDETLDRIPDEQFEELVPTLLRTLSEYSMQFKRELSELLITLSLDGDSDLKSLGLRINFNEFYMGSVNNKSGAMGMSVGPGAASGRKTRHFSTAYGPVYNYNPKSIQTRNRDPLETLLIPKPQKQKEINNTHYEEQEPGPLHGIRVLDLTRVLAGPYCTQLLGDLGAEVIKCENPRGGDDTRAWGPPFAPNKDPEDKALTESAYFLSVNRNKKSITVNFRSKEGQALIYDLVRKCDVLVENYVPGKLAEMGLDYQTVSKINPRLVYASITGYGQTGPYAKRPGYDVMIEAEAGLMYITGEEHGPPVKVGVAVTDLTTGLYAHGGILAALFARVRTGRGQHVDCSLLESQVATLANIGSSYLIAGQEAQRMEGKGVPFAPINNIGQTFEHPQVVARRMIQEIEHPKAGKIKLTGTPVKYSDTKPSIRSPPPLLGQHTDEVLRAVLGYGEEKIRALKDASA